MTYLEVANIIKQIGLPFAYYSFPINQAPNLPYLIYYYPNNEDFSADNINYIPIVQMNIELYTKQKDFELEKNIEDIFKENGLFYDKSETFIQQEQMFEILYEFNLMIKEN